MVGSQQSTVAKQDRANKVNKNRHSLPALFPSPDSRPLTVDYAACCPLPTACLKSFLSAQNVPNGTMEARKAIPVFFHDQSYSALTITSRKTYNTNNTPWAIPTCRTASGSPYMYLSGMAMKSRIRNEMPSTKAMTRRRPRVLLSNASMESVSGFGGKGDQDFQDLKIDRIFITRL